MKGQNAEVVDIISKNELPIMNEKRVTLRAKDQWTMAKKMQFAQAK